MGLIADFFVASPSDALRYASFVKAGDTIPEEPIEKCEYKNYTNLSLGLLWAALRNETWNVECHDLVVVNIADDGGSWLFRFPDEFVSLITNIDEGAVKRIAGAWADHVDVPGDGPDNEPVLLDLKRLATHAQQQGRQLYLWGSL